MTTEDADAASFQVGDVVETVYGVGVLVEARPTGICVFRLWRKPGKSVATAALAYLHKSNVRISMQSDSKSSEMKAGMCHSLTLLLLLHLLFLQF